MARYSFIFTVVFYILPYYLMGKSTIKQLAETVQITESTKLYRIGNLRILQVTGASPYSTILDTQDRPKARVVCSALATASGGNVGACLGSLVINTTGSIECNYNAYYSSQNAGFSPLYSPNELFGIAVWTV